MAQGNSNNIGGSRIATGLTSGQHTLSNNADNALDAHATEATATTTFEVGATNALTLSAAEAMGWHRYIISESGATAACTITWDATAPRGSLWVYNNGSYPHTHQISGQSEPKPVVQPGNWKHLVHDGADVVEQHGYETIWIPASAMYATTTAGAASGTVELATNKIMISSWDFDQTTRENVQFPWRAPKRWNGGTVLATVSWSHAAATSFDCIWGVEGVAFADGDALDAAFGTAQTVTDSGGTTNDLYISPETSAITIAGSPVANAEEYVIWQIYRDAGAGGDTLDVDARLHGVTLRYKATSMLDD